MISGGMSNIQCPMSKLTVQPSGGNIQYTMSNVQTYRSGNKLFGFEICNG